MNGVTVSCLGIPSNLNYNLAAGDRIPEYQKKNIQYLKEKWGNFTYTNPFNSPTIDKNMKVTDGISTIDCISRDMEIEFNGGTGKFPSEFQYKNFTKLKNDIK